MPRQLIFTIIVLAFSSFIANPAFADNIGVGKNSVNTVTTSQATVVTTDDNIGVGLESWYGLLAAWFESNDS